MYRNDSVPSRAKMILQQKELIYLRDNKKDFRTAYHKYFPLDTSDEETIGRAWRLVQQDFLELRGIKWPGRQRCSAVKRPEYSHRNLGQIEDLSSMFEQIKKEGFFVSLFRKLF